MEIEDYLNVIIWMDIRFCFSFTLLAIGLCCMINFGNLPVSYYLNLLVANVIQLILLIVIVVTNPELFLHLTCLIIYGSVATVSLYFRMMIALERCFIICWPRLHFIRQTAIISVLVWVPSLVIFTILILLGQNLVLFVFALIPSLVLMFCPLRTFVSLSRATSVSAEGKCRILGTFLLLLVNCVVTAVLPNSLFIFSAFHKRTEQIQLTLFLLSPFMDLLLFVFMREGPIDQLLSCLFCCKMETSPEDDGSRASV